MLTEIKRLQKLAGLLKESDGEYEYNALMDVVDDMFDPITEPLMHNRLTTAVEAAYNKGNLDLMGLDTEMGKARRTVEMIAQNAGIDLDGEGEKDYFEYLEETPAEVQDIVEKYAEELPGYEESDNLIDELRAIGWTCDYGLDGIPYGLRPLNGETVDEAGEPLNENEGLSPLDFTVGEDVWIDSLNTSAVVVDTEVEDEEGEGFDSIAVEFWNKQGKKEQMVVPTFDVKKLDDNEDSDGYHYGDDEDDLSYYTRRGWQAKMDEANGKTIDFRPTIPPKQKGVHIDDFEDEHHGNLDNYISKLVAQQMAKANRKVIPLHPKK